MKPAPPVTKMRREAMSPVRLSSVFEQAIGGDAARVEEALDQLVARLAELLWRAGRHDRALREEVDAIGDFQGAGHVVRDHHARDAELVAGFEDHVVDGGGW